MPCEQNKSGAESLTESAALARTTVRQRSLLRTHIPETYCHLVKGRVSTIDVKMINH